MNKEEQRCKSVGGLVYRFGLILGIVVLATSAQLNAQAADSQIPEKCAQIESDVERLVCYDNIFRRSLPAAIKAPVASDKQTTSNQVATVAMQQVQVVTEVVTPSPGIQSAPELESAPELTQQPAETPARYPLHSSCQLDGKEPQF